MRPALPPKVVVANAKAEHADGNHPSLHDRLGGRSGIRHGSFIEDPCGARGEAT
ncbi:MAG: hypothetical protein KAH96_02040 [Alphaproteobacteria bacterium]|nr:hypothetical protein [Alphaproteobacteria bacterium]